MKKLNIYKKNNGFECEHQGYKLCLQLPDTSNSDSEDIDFVDRDKMYANVYNRAFNNSYTSKEDGTMNEHNYNSSVNQKVISQLVRNEVGECVSYLISELVREAEHFPDYVDELYGAYDGLPDYQEAAQADGWEQAKNGVFYNNPGKDVEINDTAEDWQELCDDENIDVSEYCSDIFEHWTVSCFMADDLETHGHKVIRDFFDFSAVWCRPTTGQGISSDHIMGAIAETMEILEGQKNHNHWI